MKCKTGATVSMQIFDSVNWLIVLNNLLKGMWNWAGLSSN
jgi:hypothetical protein